MEINKKLIASCGMNCGICVGFLREKNKCSGCNFHSTIAHCQKCRIRLCVERTGEYCFECGKFPCARLKQLDKRYREKYGMSMLDNLESIRNNGIDKFIKNEIKRWQRSDGTLCVHNKKIYK